MHAGKQPRQVAEHASTAADAIAAWLRVGRKGRAALRKLNIDRVHDLEEQVSFFASSVCSPGLHTSPIHAHKRWFVSAVG
jgi:hypothetical protein